MGISLFSDPRSRVLPHHENVEPKGCSRDAAALLGAYALSFTPGRTPGAPSKELFDAIKAARINLPDPCRDEPLMDHLMGMSALMGLIAMRAPLPPKTKKLLPERGAFEVALALTADRAFRRTTMMLEGLKIAVQQQKPGASAQLASLLPTLNRISGVAQALRDNATTLEAFSLSNQVGVHAAKEAAAIAALLGGPDAAHVFPSFDPAQLRTPWTDVDQRAHLAMITLKTKVREASADGTQVTVSKTITTSRGHVYLLQAPLTDRTGAHGRVYPAQTIERPGEPLIAKIQRTQRKLVGAQDTLNTPLNKLLARAAASKTATARVDAGLDAHAELFEAINGPLRFLDARNTSAAVIDQFVDASGKFYQVMKAMAGDLADVSRALSAQVDADAALEPLIARARLSASVQAAIQLVGLHRRRGLKDGGMAHLDIKLPNIVFGEEGIVRIIDFDESKTLSALKRVRDGSHTGGSLSSPERDNVILQRRGGALSQPYDIWCLGAAMLELGSPTFYDASSSGPKAVHAILDPPANAPRGLGKAEWFAVYSSMWRLHIQGDRPLTQMPSAPTDSEKRQAVILLKKQLNTGHQIPDAHLEAYVDACYARLSRFINARLIADPELTAVLLRQALAPEPQRRSTAKKLAAELTKLMARQTEHERLEVQQLFSSLARKTPLTGVQ